MPWTAHHANHAILHVSGFSAGFRNATPSYSPSMVSFSLGTGIPACRVSRRIAGAISQS